MGSGPPPSGEDFFFALAEFLDFVLTDEERAALLCERPVDLDDRASTPSWARWRSTSGCGQRERAGRAHQARTAQPACGA